MLSKIKEQATAIAVSEIGKKAAGIGRQAAGKVGNVLGEQSQALGQKAQSAMIAVNVQAEKYGIRDKATKAMDICNKAILVLRLLLGLFAVLTVVGIATGSIVLIVVSVLPAIPTAIVLWKLCKWRNIGRNLINRVDTTINTAQNLIQALQCAPENDLPGGHTPQNAEMDTK